MSFFDEVADPTAGYPAENSAHVYDAHRHVPNAHLDAIYPEVAR